MKVIPIFAFLFTALMLSSVYLIQKQTSLDINDQKNCHSLFQQEVMLTTITYLQNICNKNLVFTIEQIESNDNIIKKTTKCLSYQEQQSVGGYFGDNFSTVSVSGYKEC
ncbi:hypothetical protein ABPG74_003168 [Tetrahymena malaccensis]